MSKAFTRESDDLPERPTPRRSVAASGADGARRVTTAGWRRLGEERDRLRVVPSEESARVREVRGARLREVERLLASAVVFSPPAGGEDRVGFGSTVTLRGRGGEEFCYRLVGPDEVDLEEHWVNWRSPLARALLDARVGDRVRVRLPSGEEEFEILRIQWET